jgi:glycosyltransferase 2 family protein
MDSGVEQSVRNGPLHYFLRTAGDVCRFFIRNYYGQLLMKYGVALVLLAYVIVKNWDGLVHVVERPINVQPLMLAVLIYIVGLLITFLRWHLLVRAVDLPFSRYDAVRLGLVGFYFNTFLPGSIGGDVVKAYNIARENSRRTLAVATVLIDRILGLWALIWFVALVGGLFWALGNPMMQNGTLEGIVISTMVFVAVSTAIWASLGLLSDDQATRFAARVEGQSRWRHSLAELWRACWMYRQRSGAVLIAMLVTLVAHTGWVLVFHFAVMAFEPPNYATEAGTFAEHAVVVPVGMTVSAFIPLPGGIGVGEVAYGRLYKILGKPEVNGVVGCMSQRVITYTLGFIGYLIYLRMRKGVAVVDAKKSGETNDGGAVALSA